MKASLLNLASLREYPLYPVLDLGLAHTCLPAALAHSRRRRPRRPECASTRTWLAAAQQAMGATDWGKYWAVAAGKAEAAAVAACERAYAAKGGGGGGDCKVLYQERVTCPDDGGWAGQEAAALASSAYGSHYAIAWNADCHPSRAKPSAAASFPAREAAEAAALTACVATSRASDSEVTAAAPCGVVVSRKAACTQV
ncbi:hypothetical protein HYH02_013194 [Chlamydomonas schloesseri]|uniref:DUF4189 domain-containing protein n=1 Tax=Chlamydomonas schloesseri TaxID=2026947 RepID=A0A835SRT3_9CHLO|nr:hypothetical protein HYH02_013194 [Chlamydomonas schloesseri]|eukprot:KAG2431978.1 hypothetical protein HYH02_013194 [Chlamydomonas schloesseri]